jgi:hypothetical protein
MRALPGCNKGRKTPCGYKLVVINNTVVVKCQRAQKDTDKVIRNIDRKEVARNINGKDC